MLNFFGKRLWYGISVAALLSVVNNAAALLATWSSDGQGLAIDFSDQSIAITDTSTPANEFRSVGTVRDGALVGPGAKITYTSPSPKLCKKADGTYGYRAQNLVLQSEDISNASWTKTTATAAAADELRETSASSTHTVSQNITSVAGATYVFSSEIKIGLTRTRAVLLLQNTGATSGIYTVFDIDGAQIGVTSTAYGSGYTSSISPTITSMGDGWYKCTHYVTVNDTTIQAAIRPDAGAGTAALNQSYLGVTSNGLYIRKVHVYLYPANTDYIKTTSAPLYDLPYDWTGDKYYPLVEPAATNLGTFSRSWPVHANYLPTNITRTQVTGIDGVANSAYAFEATANNANAAGYTLETTVLDTQYTRSLFIKRLTGSGPVYVAPNGWYGWKGDGTETVTGSNKITNGDFAANVTGWTVAGTPDGSNYFSWNAGGYADFASNGGITAVSQGVSGLTHGKVYRLTASITVASGSLRLSVTGAAGGRSISASGTYHILAMADPVSSLTAHFSRQSGNLVCTIDDVVVQEVTSINCDVSSQLVLNEWKRVTVPSYVAHGGNSARIILIATSGDKIAVDQHQIETGIVATSPIITAGATVTRAEDNLSIATSAFPFNAAAVTMFVEGDTAVANLAADRAFLQLSDGTNNNRLIQHAVATTNVKNFFVAVGGATQANVNSGATVAANTPHKFAASAAENDFRCSVDGVLGTPDTSGSMPAGITTLRLGRSATGHHLRGYIRKVMVLPRTSTNAELQALTA